MNMMKDELMSILPTGYRSRIQLEMIANLQEIRMRIGQPLALVAGQGTTSLGPNVSQDDLRFCINAASHYSPWNAATMQSGYLTAPGGHRIGVCGLYSGERIQQLASICIRVSKDLTGIADHLRVQNSTLIIGPPGSGKTTLLRELIRRISGINRRPISVVDERCEIFPLRHGTSCFDTGPCTDVLSGRDKASGIESVMRSMGPHWIAVDEITAPSDCQALLRAGWCGVKLLATAHASGIEDLNSRDIYQPLTASGLFRSVIVMHPDKSCHQERI